MTTKRAYKLQEFVAHSASVNCLKIGRKSSRVLVTGGEDHKVNLWAIGKPNAILSLSGHTSGIDSVCFDSSEVLVAAGAASGTVKLWDLEEAKIVRTLTGHRSNCISVDFHPFGEFFASGSLDTNLKIWDIRKKGCIHTYKGHTRGVNAIRFTPDGRWIVSGGEDNTVKLWDLTAGKLLHDFKCHEGQIECIDFHPHEFLLATGSADRTVKFWDLETFELIGSSSPETSGVRCLTFNPDGRNLLCGLHEHLKVFSWEPVRCHDAVDVGWSKLSDLNVHEGKLLGCSYNQSCVGIWVVDISRIEPYAVNDMDRLDGLSESKSSSSGNLSILNENTTKGSLGRLSTSENSDSLVKETKSLGRLSVSQNSDPVKESKISPSTGSIPGTPQRINPNTASKTNLASSTAVSNATAPKKNSTKAHSAVNVPIFNKSDVVPVIVPRTNAKFEQPAESRKVIGLPGRTMPFSLQSKTTGFRKFANSRDEMDQPTISAASETPDPKVSDSNSAADKNTFSTVKTLIHGVTEASRNIKDDKYISSGKHETSSEPDQDESYDTNTHRGNRNVESQKGRTRSVVINLQRRRRSPNYEGPTSGVSPETVSEVNMLPSNMRRHSPFTEKEAASASDEDAIADVMEEHEQFVSSMQSRLIKLQVVYRYWERNDIKGAIAAMEKMSDYSVLADVISILTEKIDVVTLDICACLLPLLTTLLESNVDRHLSISLGILLKLVRIFGSRIYSTISASTSVGVDIEAEQRFERCNLCFLELEKVKRCLPTFTRRGGSIAKSAQELNLVLQEVS
ncbi:katanin p80 WD40 repeat-containing subunit B1 homolog KTN80.4-like isoform X1 [Tripterygium wilfordii]|uniref:katanin p80 WD40 repeat-containing subunit B1 homolog KTN80.4-like isoform X1 n=1 Tax=Tripterygium wilfordii TaxID=458696 RepID=UPI0018F833AB|nr:katanin p80 WD40 repeat-containing subunit B1 homolog KTN80.4-like isoform X1 [Tripterygium wilfordii]